MAVIATPQYSASQLSMTVSAGWLLSQERVDQKPQGLDQTLEKIRTDYGNAFTVKKFTGPSNGAGNGLPNPVPTLADLVSGRPPAIGTAELSIERYARAA